MKTEAQGDAGASARGEHEDNDAKADNKDDEFSVAFDDDDESDADDGDDSPGAGAKPITDAAADDAAADVDGDQDQTLGAADDAGSGTTSDGNQAGDDDSQDTQLPQQKAASERAAEIAAEAAQEAYLKALEATHADVRTLYDSQELADWLARSGAEMRRKAVSGSVEDGIAVLDAFKARSNKGPKRYTIEDLSDVDIPGPDDTSIKFGEFADQAAYGPEVSNAILRVSEEIAERRFAPIQEELQQIKDRLLYSEELYAAHPDARSVMRQDNYAEWLKAQAPEMRRLEHTNKASDQILLLDAFKESIARQSKDTADERQREVKQRKTDLHKHTLRGKPVALTSRVAAQDEYDAAWDEDD